MQTHLSGGNRRRRPILASNEPASTAASENDQPIWRVLEDVANDVANDVAENGEVAGVEIEGESIALDNDLVGPLPLPPTTGDYAAIADQADEVLVAGLEVRHCTVAPGESVRLRVALLNNGDRYACFQVHVEGWLDENWVRVSREDSPDNLAHVQVWLQPGERCLITVAIAPPRVAASTAGERPFAVVVQSPQYAGRRCRLGATLTIQPYTNLTLGRLDAHPRATSWWQRTARLRLPVTNGGNCPAQIFVQAQDGQRRCQIRLRLSDGSPTQPGRATLTLSPGETTLVMAQVTTPPPPLFALGKRHIQVQMAAGLTRSQQTPLVTSATVTTAPLIGPRAIGLFLALMMIGVLGALAVGALALALSNRNPIASAPVVEAAPAPTSAPQPITIIVNLAQPAATAPPPGAAAAWNGQVAPVIVSAQDAGSAPLVRADQVTAPGQPTRPSAFQPGAASAPPAESEPLTYQQMFQEVALRYDLDWRALAAQAYIESGFDSLALGDSGDMGLMQILPGTWREWAAVANVNDPFDAYSNVTVAAIYLDHLRSKLSAKGYPQIEWMLVAYNWGIDKVDTHLQAGLGWDDLPASRRQYALDILHIAETIPAQ